MDQDSELRNIENLSQQLNKERYNFSQKREQFTKECSENKNIKTFLSAKLSNLSQNIEKLNTLYNSDIKAADQKAKELESKSKAIAEPTSKNEEQKMDSHLEDELEKKLKKIEEQAKEKGEKVEKMTKEEKKGLVSKLKGFFRSNDDGAIKADIGLDKNFHYDPIKKKYVFAGEPEPEEKKKMAPPKASEIKEKKEEEKEEKGTNSLLQPRKVIIGGKIKGGTNAKVVKPGFIPNVSAAANIVLFWLFRDLRGILVEKSMKRQEIKEIRHFLNCLQRFKRK